MIEAICLPEASLNCMMLLDRGFCFRVSFPTHATQNTSQLCKHPGLTSTFVSLAHVQAILGDAWGTWALATVSPLQTFHPLWDRKVSSLKNNSTPLVRVSRPAEWQTKTHTADKEEFLWKNNKTPGQSDTLTSGILERDHFPSRRNGVCSLLQGAAICGTDSTPLCPWCKHCTGCQERGWYGHGLLHKHRGSSLHSHSFFT